MKNLKAAVDNVVKLNQSQGAFWIPGTAPIDETVVETNSLQHISYANGGSVSFINGTEEMHEKLAGKRIPVLGTIPEGATELVFYLATAQREFKNDQGVVMTSKGDQRVVLMPA